MSVPSPRRADPVDTRADWQILVAHGAGSTAATARALLTPVLEPVAGRRSSWVGIDERGGDVEEIAQRIQDWLDRTSATQGPRVVCGISLGAHAALMSTRRHSGSGVNSGPEGYVLALPAWIGAPAATASATADTGQRIAEMGISQTLAEIDAGTPDDRRWLVDTLRHDWSHYTDVQLTRSLLAAARSSGPTLDDLGAVAAPTLVIAATEDPFHPIATAQVWAGAIRDSILAEIDFPRTRGFLSDRTLAAARQFAARLGSSSHPW